MNRKIYFDNLDGLRFLCFLSVFFYHSFHSDFDYILQRPEYGFIKRGIFGNGNLGVNFFFVLSGFLITFLLIEEKKLNGRINIGKFWMRRVLRIWPLYFLCVVFGFFVFPMIKAAFGQVPTEIHSIWPYLTFTSNFEIIRKGLPDCSILGVLWSIAVEEQFYLFWPILLSFIPIKRFHFVFIGVLLISFVFRAFNDTIMIHENHSLSCMGDMAIGALGAWLITERSRFKLLIVNVSRYKIAAAYSVMLIIFLFRGEIVRESHILRIFERSMVASVILFIILEQNYATKSFFKMSSFKTFSKLGLITYGLYCLHFLAILITNQILQRFGFNTHLWQVLLLETSISLLLSIWIAKISFRFVERPFLRIKESYSYIIKRKSSLKTGLKPLTIIHPLQNLEVGNAAFMKDLNGIDSENLENRLEKVL